MNGERNIWSLCYAWHIRCKVNRHYHTFCGISIKSSKEVSRWNNWAASMVPHLPRCDAIKLHDALARQWGTSLFKVTLWEVQFCFKLCNLFFLGTEIGLSWCSRFLECCRQVEAEVVSNNSSKLYQTWNIDFGQTLYSVHGAICRTVSGWMNGEQNIWGLCYARHIGCLAHSFSYAPSQVG